MSGRIRPVRDNSDEPGPPDGTGSVSSVDGVPAGAVPQFLPTDAAGDDDRRARVWLSRVVEPGQRVATELLDRLGPAVFVDRILAGDVPEPLRRATELRRQLGSVDADLAAADRHGIRFLTPEDGEWPGAALHPGVVATQVGGRTDLAPPWGLWVRGEGELVELFDRCVAVIGARAATPYGEHCAAELAFGLAERGWTVVSGGAYGIDGAAHRGALAAGGRTVAFLAGGLDAPYPSGNSRLFQRIVENGALVSEWPPGSVPQRHRFLIRNRLIATVAAGTVVVEAAARSGTSNTASQVKKLGRLLMAFPGPTTSAMSVGTHELIRTGDAQLVTRLEDVLEVVGRVGDDLAPRRRAVPDDRDGLDPLARQVLEGLPARRTATPEQIAAEAAVPVGDVLRVLPSLELDGRVERSEGGWRLRRPRRRSGG
jgi:DNA processing protein